MGRVILIPGNGCGEGPNALDDCMWYPWIAKEVSRLGYHITLTGFPDHIGANEEIWKSFVIDTLELDKDSVVIGHSSGSACALRLMEEHSFAACVLVSAYNTDLGDELEKNSGYFSRPFDYERMRKNVPKIIQFHSKNDHLVPVEVARDLNKLLGCLYVETKNDGHFQESEYNDVMLESMKAQCILEQQ